MTDEAEALKQQLNEANQDIEVLNNDKEVLDSERRRLENEKVELGLDLMAVSTEKLEVEKKLTEVEQQKSELLSRIEDLVANISELNNQVKVSDGERVSFTSELAEIRDVAMKQKLSLDEKEQVISDLQSDVAELEMKTVSLDGSLSSAMSELNNLKAENEALFRSNEKIEETVRGYIHKCQALELLNDELLATKEDLNQTCVILESRMNSAEIVCEEKTAMVAQMETAIEEKDATICKLKGDIASLESKNVDLQEMVSILRQQNSTSAEIAQETEASLSRKISELEAALFRSKDQNEKSDAELESARAECRQLIDLNGLLSQQVSESHAKNVLLASREEELTKRLEKLKADLEAAHQGMDTELNQRWDAEDEILHLQAENDRVSDLFKTKIFQHSLIVPNYYQSIKNSKP